MFEIAAGIILGGLALGILAISFFMWVTVEPHDPWRPVIRLAMIAAAITAAAIISAAARGACSGPAT
jgi:hypothetical protein